MSKHDETFFDKYSLGFALADDIHDAIDEWHDSDSELPLYAFLGLTREEYAFWAKYPKKLHMILMARANNFSLEDALRREADLSVAARNCKEEEMDALKVLLKKMQS